ncbi:MAG: hypothetical protein JEZ11_11040 [Desulfobacterales bacterium]|nr:hypothetical protein [Desulfobacterales bacterium]
MKTLLLVLVGLTLVGLAALSVAAFGPTLVVMEDGRLIGVDRVLARGDAWVLHCDGQQLIEDQKRVSAVLSGLPRTPEAMALRLRFGLNRAETLWRSMDRRHRRFSMGAGFLVFLVLFAGSLLRRRKEPAALETMTGGPAAVKLKPVVQTPRLVGLADVERFFLNLYRRQIGASPGAPGRIEEIANPSGGKGRICQLSIKHNDEWRTRRMTLGPIGEGSGSRSQCFYAIFDTHMVIKIPPTPIRDFEDYVQRIQYESALVECLSPRECVIPSLSVILSRVHRFAGLVPVTAAALEAQYIDLLKTMPEYRDYLRIGGTFAFFMDLARHCFMSQALSELDDATTLLAATATADADPTGDCRGFETRYGGQNGWACFDLQKLCRRFEVDARSMVADGAGETVGPGRLREFFYQSAAGVGSEAVCQDLPPTAAGNIVSLGQTLLATEPELQQAYATMAWAHADSKAFARNRPRMEALAVNLLELLAWLGKRGVAMRDLKPDNLLVAGNPDAYPLFLASADDFTLGLIDVETACDFGSMESGTGVQPQLGGTPGYATPAHFFPNRVLAAVHGDLGEVLHHQDWHAVAAIIFETATGKRLFGQTAGQIPRIMAALQKAVMERRSLVDLYRAVNGIFWKQAAEEFSRVTAAHSQRLEALRVQMPRFLIKAAGTAMGRARQRLDDRFGACLARRSEGLSLGDRQKLLACSADQLQRLQEKYRISGTGAHHRIAAWFGDLAALKQAAEILDAAMTPVPDASTAVSVRRLLALMHYATVGVMAADGPVAAEPSPLEEIPDVPEINPCHTATVQLP